METQNLFSMETKTINGNIPEVIFKTSDEIQFWDTASITRPRELLCNAVLLYGPADLAGR